MDQEKNTEMFVKILDRLDEIDNRLNNIDNCLDKVDNRLDKVDNRLDNMEVRQNKMAAQLAELQLAQKHFEVNMNKKYARLQDSVDTIEEILKINNLLPR